MKKNLNDKLFLSCLIIFSIVALIPLFASHFFLSLDGPDHLYNAQLVNELIFHHTKASTYLAFNNFPVPNSFGHWLLQLFLLIFPPFLAEKILVAIIILGFPFLGLKLAILKPENKWFVFFFFPLGFSAFLGLGFYNFLFGCLFLLLLIYYFLKPVSLAKWKTYLLRFLLWTALYFSHLLLFSIGLVTLFLGVLLFAIKEKTKVKSFIVNCLDWFSPALPAIILAVLFFLKQNGGQGTYLSMSEIIQMVKDGYPLIAYHSNERPLVRLFLLLLLVIIIIAIWKTWKNRKINFIAIYFLCLLIVLKIMLITFPDTTLSGGFVTGRLIYLLFVFGCCFVLFSDLKLSKWMILIPLFPLHFISTIRRYNEMKGRREAETFMLKSQGLITDNATLLSLNFSNPSKMNWLDGHSVARLAKNGSIVIFNNYETIQAYFPLKWKNQSFIYDNLYSNHPKIEEIAKLNPDYLFINFFEDGNEIEQEFIKHQYSLLLENSSNSLFKRKN